MAIPSTHYIQALERKEDLLIRASRSVIDNAREAEKVQKGRQIAIALDTKGPEIRTGNTVGDEDIPIAAGTEINITTDEKYATACDLKNM